MNSLLNLEVYDSVKRWLNKLEAKSRSVDFSKSSTKRAALYWLRVYCKFLKTNPDSLMADRNETLKSGSKATQRKHEELLDDFIIQLRRNDKSPNTISTATGLVRSFYKANYADLKEVTRVKIYKVRPFKVPMVEDIRKICKVADPYTKAWICSQKDSGLGNIDLLRLSLNTLSSEFGTIKTQLKKGIVPIHLEIRRQKTGEATHSFLGPNAIDTLNEYLPPKSRKSVIFYMSDRTIQKRIKTLAIQTKVASESVPVTPYTLRKFFNTTMKYIAKVPESVVETWMGHSIGRVRSAYSVIGTNDVAVGMPISKMAETYMEAYPYIDITKVG
jgi:integrase